MTICETGTPPPIRPVRVLQLIPSTSMGGIESLTLSLVSSLSERSLFDFHIAALNPTQPVLKDRFESTGATVHFIAAAGVGTSLISKVSWRIRSVINFRSLIANGHFDVLHCHLGPSHTPYTLLAWLGGIPTRIVHSHEAPPQDRVQRRFLLRRVRSLLRLDFLVTHKIGCGLAATQWLWGESTAGALPPRTIYNGIDAKRFKEARQRRSLHQRDGSRCVNLLHVGRFSAPKNQLFLLEVFSQLAQRVGVVCVHLNIVGYGPLESELKERVASLGLKDSVTFHHQDADVAELMSTTDAFLLPSIREGLPIVAVESQVAGVPIVVSDSVTREIDLGLARFVPLSSGVSGWVDQIIEIIKSPPAISEALEEFDRFNMEFISTEWDDLYSSGLALGEAPSRRVGETASCTKPRLWSPNRKH